jgi:hypothetical protein
MATSGSTDLSLTTRDIVNRTFDIMGLVAAGEDVQSEDATRALNALELLLKTLGTTGRLWLAGETALTLVASTASYTLPVGVNTVTGIRRRTSNIDTPLTEIAREDYFDLPTKTATGTPVNWYQDRQRATVTLYVWPTASTATAASTTLRYTYQRIIEDCDSLNNDPDVPQEWLETLAYNLADRLASRYGVTGDLRQDIKLTASQLLKQLIAQDDEPSSVFLGVGR